MPRTREARWTWRWSCCRAAGEPDHHVNRTFYLDLAASGLRMPIATHLVLHEHPDPAGVVTDGERLGKVVEEAARRFHVPLGLPLMDLKLEKESLLRSRDVPAAEVDTYHFSEIPHETGSFLLTENMAAVCGAIRYVANETDLLPVGMGIGPFSLATKLLADPISPVFLAGTGVTGEEDPEVALLDWVIDAAFQTASAYYAAQMDAGAKAIIVCEPAANMVFFSPNQLNESYEVFDRCVMRHNLTLREQFRQRDVDLIFHDCGELTDGMVERFGALDPAMLSLGSSRNLWEDAARIPKSTVLYGNLPTKRFYSDSSISVEAVRELSRNLAQRMGETGHPFILGSECDVLSVPGREETILAKVEAFLEIP